MKAKRILCLLLAVLMVMGTVTWLITLIASADEPNTASLIGYRLETVYSSRNGAKNGTACYIKGSEKYTAYKIHRGYYADFDITITMTFDEESKAASFVEAHKESEVVKLNVAVDSGSFSVDSNVSPNAVVKNLSASGENVQINVDVDKVMYSGEGKTLGFTLYDDDYTDTYSIDISQCVPYEKNTDKDDEEDEDHSDIPDPTPYVIISGYNYGGGNVIAGQEFTLNLTIENTSNMMVGNMTMTVDTPNAFTLVNSSNTVYIENLGAGKTFTHSVRMMARASAEPEPAVLDISFNYQYIADGTRKDVSRSEKIAIPVSQRDRFQVDELILPAQLWTGEEYDLEVKYTNKGRSTVYNLSAALQGEGLVEANQSETVGNVESGKSGTIDFFLMTDMPGTLSGNVVVTYEDVNMNEKTITLPYSIEIMAMEEPAYQDPTADIVYNEDGSYYGPDGILYGPDGMPLEEDGVEDWKTYAIIGGCVLAGVVVLIVAVKKRKAARLLKELEEDNNEDI